MPKTPRIYIALLINAMILAGLILWSVWVDNIDEKFFGRLIGTGLLMGIFLSFIAVFRSDFAALPSLVLGYIVLTLVSTIQVILLVLIWDLWVLNISAVKILVTLGIFLALAFYILSLKEDLLREYRQRKDGYLD